VYFKCHTLVNWSFLTPGSAFSEGIEPRRFSPVASLSAYERLLVVRGSSGRPDCTIAMATNQILTSEKLRSNYGAQKRASITSVLAKWMAFAHYQQS
jgi:hypothetical protein